MTKRGSKIGSGEAERFDQRNTMFSRPRNTERSSPEILDLGKKHYGVRQFKDEEGYTLLDWAFSMGSWYLERWWGFGNITGTEGLYEWFPDQSQIAAKDRIPPDQHWKPLPPGGMSRIVKKAALYMGASSVGICRLDRRWVYSHRFDPRNGAHSPSNDIPEDCTTAIVMLHEMVHQSGKVFRVLGSQPGRLCQLHPGLCVQ
jgi:hypothetical protein